MGYLIPRWWKTSARRTATKTKASHLIWVGAVLMILGIAAFASMGLGFMSKVSNGLSNPDTFERREPNGIRRSDRKR